MVHCTVDTKDTFVINEYFAHLQCRYCLLGVGVTYLTRYRVCYWLYSWGNRISIAA